MNPSIAETERKMIFLSMGGNLTIGIVGVIFAVLSDSQAIMLDGFFNLAFFGMGLFTLKISELVKRGDNIQFPFGYAFFEPLANGIKGVLVLGVSIMALAGAIQDMFAGGNLIEADKAVYYGLFAAIVCGIMAYFTRKGALISGSPLVRVDAQNWIVNAAISSAVLLTFIGIIVIQGTSWAFILPFVDPSLVILVVIITISVPVRMAWDALMELLNRTPSQQLLRQMTRLIQESLSELPVKQMFVRVIQPGRTRMVSAHVVLPPEHEIGSLLAFDRLREKTENLLKQEHEDTVLDLIFTADPSWGAPVSQIKSMAEHK